MRYLVRNVEDMGKCHLHYALGAVRWYVAHHYSMTVSILNINVIVTRCQLADILQTGQLPQLFFFQTTLVRQNHIGILCTFVQVFGGGAIIYGKFAPLLQGFPRQVVGVGGVSV